MRLVASLAFQGFGAAVLPASAAPGVPGDMTWKRIAIEGATGRSVGLARRRRGLPSAPARAIREVLRRVVTDQAARQPGIRVVAP
jgi:LysR family hydrogen peroxide-inducible transcriptional activator